MIAEGKRREKGAEKDQTPSDGARAELDAARDAAKHLVASWREAGFEPRRESAQAIIKDVDFAEGYMRQTDLPSWDVGRARNEKVLAWARRESEALQAVRAQIAATPRADGRGTQ